MLFRQIFDPVLAQYAYLIGCQRTKEALLVDPERDIDKYLEIAAAEGLDIVSVAETHIHADFLSGAREFAERGARVYLSDEGDADWKYEWVKGSRRDGSAYDFVLLNDGDAFRVGNIEIETVATPGHTPEHLAFMVTDLGGGATKAMGMVSGDFVFVNDLGRPDLLESAAQVEGAMEPSARQLYASVQRFLKLPDYLQVWPAHGAGSACGKALGAVPQTTVGYERMYNPSIGAAHEGEDRFVSEILTGQPEPPLYFARMKRDNKLGPALLGDLPEPRGMGADQLAALATGGPGQTPVGSASGDGAPATSAAVARQPVVLDTRADRQAFMAQHLRGSIYAPLTNMFANIVGSFVTDETTPLVLVVDPDKLDDAVRRLVRIGYDHIVGYAGFSTLETALQQPGAADQIEVVRFEDVERSRDEQVVLDVRFQSEYDSSHVPGAVNASYTRLPEYEHRIPAEGTLLVHCKSGARAAAASSYLARQGRTVRYVDDAFDRYSTEVGEPESTAVSA